MKLTIATFAKTPAFGAAVVAWGLLSGGCGTSVETKSEEFTYSYNINGCKTVQTFKSQAEYCRGLRDEDLNHGCAQEVREAAFRSKCLNTMNGG
jgi:hypothetical protein